MAENALTRRSTFQRLRSQISPKPRPLKEGPDDSPPPVSLPSIRPDDIVIAVMGVTGVGKSKFISHLSKTAEVGDGVKSCTTAISIHAAFLEGRNIYLIDTPGFDDTTRTDTEILGEIAAWLKKSYDDKVQLAGIVYLHHISDNRVGGSGVTNIRLFKELCGEQALSCVVLATTMWDLMPRDKAERREQELICKEQFWGGLLQHGCRAMRQDDGSVSATRIIRHILAQKSPRSFQIQDEMANGTPLIETRVGMVLEEKIDAQARQINEQIKKLEEEIARLKTEKEERDKREEEERQRRAEEEAKRLEKEAQNEKKKQEREAQIEKEKLEKEAQKEKEKFEREAQKEEEKLEREAQKEKEKLKREAQKEKEKLEREAQKEKERQEWEAQKERERQEWEAEESRERERRDTEMEDRLKKLEEKFASAKEQNERNEKEREELKKPRWHCAVM
ncbi:P-loop containing nucleoside triphosphate hydrolase protein [Lasiosphaeris hirsuta]|uniref:P-loop containing nucleoside triphosphate hydrolase protein n=1 Tax=Lasiosphaeris hirsuta TaxID=260670 RepID=A0AA40B204_9PEZI|nr:P-loop containing nucleoside triphosphate hydrolase protein [Lasiosphaeris hirsuta]